MKEYSFTGRLTLEGVTFFVKAESEEEAREKARAGQYDGSFAGSAGACDWDINPNTLVLEDDNAA